MVVSACREPLAVLGGPGAPGAAKHRAVVALDALAARVAEPLRDAKYDSARARIAYAALIPSRAWSDTSVWTSADARTRTLMLFGRFENGRYRLDATPVARAPNAPAESRQEIRLTRLNEGEYSWYTDVAYAVGAVRSEDVATTVRMLFTSMEGRDDNTIRADYRSAMPRASRVMGQLIQLDSIQTSRLGDGSTLATLSATLTPRRIEQRYPNFSRYLKKYGETSRMHWRIADRAGATYFDFLMREGRIRIRVRSRDRRLVPIGGEARPLPDTLVLHGDVALKVRIFTAGFRDYRAQFVLGSTPAATSFAIESREEPEWVLPLVGERLLRSPLRRPFQGEGALFRMTVTDSAPAQTILRREARLDVKESAIMRFLTRLSSAAYGDFSGKVEKEELQWLRELMTGLVADVKDL